MGHTVYFYLFLPLPFDPGGEKQPVIRHHFYYQQFPPQFYSRFGLFTFGLHSHNHIIHAKKCN